MPHRLLRAGFVALIALAVWARPSTADAWGGIEIGAKGVKATALEVSGGADGFDARVVLSGTSNTTLVAGLASTGRFTAEALKETADAVAKFVAQMEKEHAVPGDRVFVVGSSGLFSALADKPDLVRGNEQQLADAVKAATGKAMTFIDATREAELSIVGIVPRTRQGDSLLMDVGSGNTKGGFRTGPRTFVTADVPYGTVTFADLVKSRMTRSYAATAANLREDVLAPALKAQTRDRPQLLKKDRLYLSGGSVWALATFTRPGERGAFVGLTAADVESYRRALQKAAGSYPPVVLDTIADGADRAAASRDVERVQKTYTPEQMLAGAEILKALCDEFGVVGDKKALFARHGHLGWILAFVAEKLPLMDDRLRTFLFGLAGAGLFGAMGGLFGAATGAAMRIGGRTAGAAPGLAAARWVAVTRGRPLTPVAEGLLVGGTDGVCFLGVLGLIFGLAVAWAGSDADVLWKGAAGFGLLTLGAMAFGCAAYGLVRTGTAVVVTLFLGSMAGSGVGYFAAESEGLLWGALVGATLGGLVGWARRPGRD